MFHIAKTPVVKNRMSEAGSNCQIQILSDQGCGIQSLFVLDIGIALIRVLDPGRGGAAGYIAGATFRADSGFQGDRGRKHLAARLCGLGISVAYMLLLMGPNLGSRSFWRNMGCRFKGHHFVGAVLIFAVFAGLTLGRGGFPAGRNLSGFSGIYHCL